MWDDRREKAEEYERSILLHLRQISLYDSPERMVSFMESVLVEGYLDRQPDLLSTIYDELDLERPIQLRQLFSPTGQLLAQPTSFQPNRSAPSPTGQLPVLQVSSQPFRSASSPLCQLQLQEVSFQPELWIRIRIRIGSGFNGSLDPDPAAEKLTSNLNILNIL